MKMRGTARGLAAFAGLRLASLVPAVAEQPPPVWPFSFAVGGVPSSALLPTLPSTLVSTQLDAQRTQNVTTWSDHSTGFVVTWTVVEYAGLADDAPVAAGVTAREWLLTFSANGSEASPVLSDVYPLDVEVPDSSGANGSTLVLRSRGSFASPQDYEGVNITLAAPQPPPPLPPLLNHTRVWGLVIHHDTTTPTAAACRDLCVNYSRSNISSDNHFVIGGGGGGGGGSGSGSGSACAGMAFSELSDPSLDGCWLVGPTVERLTDQDGFTSWVAAPLPAPALCAAWAPQGGRSSNFELPFWTVVASGGAAATYSLGWSGNWAAVANRSTTSGATAVRVSHPTLAAALAPGEAPVRTMRVVQVGSNIVGGWAGLRAGVGWVVRQLSCKVRCTLRNRERICAIFPAALRARG